jgi:hypothetical protein
MLDAHQYFVIDKMPEQHDKSKLHSRKDEGNIVTKFKGIAEEDNQVHG